MPQFKLDTFGAVGAIEFRDLNAFAQGYVEALFFTESGDAVDGKEIGDAGFDSLAPSALSDIIKDCDAVEEQHASMWRDGVADDEQAGRDFWFTRNGHGVGFWDRDTSFYGEHAAFQDDFQGEIGGILYDLAKRACDGGFAENEPFPIRDSNGNRVGELLISESGR